jgi:uncharacterized protein YjiK
MLSRDFKSLSLIRKLFIFILPLAFVFTFCDKSGKSKTESVTGFGYNLSAPDKTYKLPQTLQEISGITEIDSSTIACVQDEHEVVFFYDLNSNQIVSRIDNRYKGDYEGITRVDTTLYILRSDGMITEIKDFNSEKSVRSTYSTDIPLKDNEGICYDPDNNYLLITPKESPGKRSEDRDKRFIYGFDLTSGKLIPEPVIIIDLSVIDSFAIANNIKAPGRDKKKDKKKDPDIKFRISGIDIHPLNGRLFLLSSIDKLLFIFNMNSELENIITLNPELFKQPEGITFFKNGDLLISNEGRNKAATLLLFKYHPTDDIRSNK